MERSIAQSGKGFRQGTVPSGIRQESFSGPSSLPSLASLASAQGLALPTSTSLVLCIQRAVAILPTELASVLNALRKYHLLLLGNSSYAGPRREHHVPYGVANLLSPMLIAQVSSCLLALSLTSSSRFPLAHPGSHFVYVGSVFLRVPHTPRRGVIDIGTSYI